MAMLGDIGFSIQASIPITAMENYWPVGQMQASYLRATGQYGAFAHKTELKQPNSVIISIPAPAVSLMLDGIMLARAYGAVNSRFYDYDDGVYHAYEVNSGNAWKVTVLGSSVTVEPIGGSGGANTRVATFIY